ncbi:TNF receptor-associated factor 3 [Paramuricea clavata]|uniref:TNF receptor-associated factor 3 n=1 Tax=Paramuricea clavata TaxID=317549 RepID=A0A6S7GQ16_PARCT|nr:TNF receptor-associated factor 3 [Paramuricea clavata]
MADVKKKIKARQGHRTFVESVMTKSRELIAGEITEDICRKLQVNKRILEGKIALLESINGEIVDLLNAKDNIEKEIIDSSEFNATVDECLVQIDIVLTESAKVQVSPHQPVLTPSTAPIKAKLPKLSLNKFSGNPVDWQAFWDSFDSAVGSNSSLSDVDKFNYLKSLLHGSAAETISGFSLTKENYCEAIKLLKERYGNKQVVISSQMDSLLKLPEATSMGEVKKLRNIYDKLESHVRSLRNVGVSPDTYGSFLAPVVMLKIPEELRIIITRDLPSGEWKLEPLLKIFNTELQLREKCALVSGTGQRKEQHFSQRDKGKYINRYQSSTAALLTENKNVQSREGPWCTFCNGNHPSSNYTIVTDISARKQILRRRGKCFKCLKTGHLVRDCKSGKPCYNCGNNHHTSICETRSKPKTYTPQSVNPNIPQQRNPPFVPLCPSTNMFVHQPPYYPVGPPCHSNTPHVPNASAFPFTPQQTNVSSSNPFVPTYPAKNMHAPQFPYSPI